MPVVIRLSHSDSAVQLYMYEMVEEHIQAPGLIVLFMKDQQCKREDARRLLRICVRDGQVNRDGQWARLRNVVTEGRRSIMNSLCPSRLQLIPKLYV